MRGKGLLSFCELKTFCNCFSNRFLSSTNPNREQIYSSSVETLLVVLAGWFETEGENVFNTLKVACKLKLFSNSEPWVDNKHCGCIDKKEYWVTILIVFRCIEALAEKISNKTRQLLPFYKCFQCNFLKSGDRLTLYLTIN